MNVNPLIMELENITQLPVYPDEFEGSETEYITFTYQDERPGESGDDEVMMDVAYIQVTLFTSPLENYMKLKDKIKTYLESIGIVTNVQSYVYKIGGTDSTKIRQTDFEVEIVKGR